MMYTDPSGHIDQWDEDREWGDNDHDGIRDDAEVDNDGDSDDDGTPDWNDPDDQDYGNPVAMPGGGASDDRDRDRDRDRKKDRDDPIEKAIDKLKKEIDYRNNMGEYGLANKAKEILAQIEMLKQIIGQQKATDNWSINNRGVYTASLNNTTALRRLAEGMSNTGERSK